MLNLAGYITFPPDPVCQETGLQFTASEFYQQCKMITDGLIACPELHLHNAWFGISLFDFSNHGSGIDDVIEELLVFVKRFSHDDISFFVRVIDDERQGKEDLNRPYTKMWTYGR